MKYEIKLQLQINNAIQNENYVEQEIYTEKFG